MVATASLDGYIRLWTNDELKLKTELEDLDAKKAAAKTDQTVAGTRNIAGIRSLSYTPENGGYLLSAGYTPYVNVWSPDASLSKAFVGRLEGHAGVVLAARIFKKSTLAVSVDDRFNIRTWDLRALKPLQNIRNDTLNPASVTCLATLPGEARFIIGGRRILMFTNEHTQRDMMAFQEELYPIEIEFNPYFGNLQILTKHDVRVFSAYSGRIKQVFTDLFDGGLPVELTAMTAGPRDRKFFLADNSGNLKMFNARSGDQIKALFDADSFSPGHKKLIEIIQIIFIEAQGLLLMIANDSSIRVAEWKAAGDTVEMLRELRGAHRGADITCAIYSKETLTLFTGASDGGIASWAFESAKLSGFFKHSSTDITAIHDLFPYPAIAATDSRGVLAIYKTRDWRKSPPLLWLIPITDHKGIPRPLSVLSVLPSPIGAAVFKLPAKDIHQKAISEPSALPKPNKMMSYEELVKLDSSVKQTKEQLELFIGGSAGWMYVLPIEHLLKMRGIEPLPASDFNERRWERYKVSLMRKDNLNAEISVQKISDELALLYPPADSRYFGIPGESLIQRKWKAHTDLITAITPLKMFSGLLTGSKDRQIKLWSSSGESWGNFSLLGTQVGSWKFPLDWVTVVLKELDNVLTLISLLEKAEFEPDQIPLIQTRYLFRNYILPEARSLKQIDAKDIFTKVRFFQRLATERRPLPAQAGQGVSSENSVNLGLTQAEQQAVQKHVKTRLDQIQKISQDRSSKPKEPIHNVFRNRYDLNRGYWEGIERESIARAKQEYDGLLWRVAPEPKGGLSKKLHQKMYFGEEMTVPPAEMSREEKPLDTSVQKPQGRRAREPDLADLGDYQADLPSQYPRGEDAPKFRVTGLPRPLSLNTLHGKPPQHGWNIRYRKGESKAVLWKASLMNTEKAQADIGSRMNSDLEVVRANHRMSAQTIRNLVDQQSSRPSTAAALGKEKIVAKKSFFLNPSVHSMKNMKIIRTGQGIYVL